MQYSIRKHTKDSKKLIPVNCTSTPWMPEIAWWTCSDGTVRHSMRKQCSEQYLQLDKKLTSMTLNTMVNFKSQLAPKA